MYKLELWYVRWRYWCSYGSNLLTMTAETYDQPMSLADCILSQNVSLLSKAPLQDHYSDVRQHRRISRPKLMRFHSIPSLSA